MTRPFACVLVVAALPACVLDHETPPCAIDGATPIELVVATAGGAVSVVTTGGDAPLIAAPQGGHILLVGARLQLQTSSCRLQINAALRDPTTNRVLGLEQRPVTIRGTQHGWASPPEPAELSDLANVAVCPTAAATQNIYGNPYQLEVRLLDGNEATVLEATTMVSPSCADMYCERDCAAPGSI